MTIDLNIDTPEVTDRCLYHPNLVAAFGNVVIDNIDQLLGVEIANVSHGVPDLVSQVARVFYTDQPLVLAQALENAGVDASPIGAFQLSGHWTFAPASAPVPSSLSNLPTRPEADGTVHRKGLVVVIDTGYVDFDAPSWYTGYLSGLQDVGSNMVYPLDEGQDEEVLESGSPFYGHGTFVASIIRRLQPNYEVAMVRIKATEETENRTTNNGQHGFISANDGWIPLDQLSFASDEVQFLDAVLRTVVGMRAREEAPTVLNISGGVYLDCGDLGIKSSEYRCPNESSTAEPPVLVGGDENQIIPVLQAMALCVWNDRSPIVAAAGNDGHAQSDQCWNEGLPAYGPDCSPFYPAAFDGVYDVSSITKSNQLSIFTNQGRYFAAGDPLIGLTPQGTFEWSGTSFASAYYAATLRPADDPVGPCTLLNDCQTEPVGDNPCASSAVIAFCETLIGSEPARQLPDAVIDAHAG